MRQVKNGYNVSSVGFWSQLILFRCTLFIFIRFSTKAHFTIIVFYCIYLVTLLREPKFRNVQFVVLVFVYCPQIVAFFFLIYCHELIKLNESESRHKHDLGEREREKKKLVIVVWPFECTNLSSKFTLIVCEIVYYEKWFFFTSINSVGHVTCVYDHFSACHDNHMS